MLSLFYVYGNANNVVFVVKRYAVRRERIRPQAVRRLKKQYASGRGPTLTDSNLTSNVSCSGYNARGEPTYMGLSNVFFGVAV